MRKTSRRLDYLPWNRVTESVKDPGIIIIPVGAVEPHGYHLPLGADVFIALEIAERLADASGGLVFPPSPLGTMNVIYDLEALSEQRRVRGERPPSLLGAAGREDECETLISY